MEFNFCSASFFRLFVIFVRFGLVFFRYLFIVFLLPFCCFKYFGFRFYSEHAFLRKGGSEAWIKGDILWLFFVVILVFCVRCLFVSPFLLLF